MNKSVGHEFPDCYLRIDWDNTACHIYHFFSSVTHNVVYQFFKAYGITRPAWLFVLKLAVVLPGISAHDYLSPTQCWKI